MGISGGPNILGDENLVFIYDIADTDNCYLGRPTTNILANAGLSTYNNASANVTSNLSATSETYRGATVWRQDLTALDASGASYLSNASNPGIGVVTSGGGGTANTYTGHSIFFKPTVPMSSSPIFTSYSNIGGWQSSNLYESMGDGWFRAYVLWYDTVTRSDGKYWAINPLSTTIGQTVTIYWAGPFREDLNSTFISPFVNGTRSISGSLFDISPNRNLITLTNMSYINGQPSFDGTDDYINLLTNIQSGFTAATYEFVCYPTSIPGTGAYGQLYIQETSTWIALYNPSGTPAFGIDLNNGAGWFDNNGGFNTGARTTSTITANKFYHLVFSWSSSTVSVYLNGSLQSTVSTLQAANGRQNVSTLGIGTTSRGIGSRFSGASSNFVGSIPLIRFYNKGLSPQEVYNNYIIQKARFGL
jgi:hypothetical protein